MTSRQKSLLWALALLVLASLALALSGSVGSVEVPLWLGVVTALVVAFFTWGRGGSTSK